MPTQKTQHRRLQSLKTLNHEGERVELASKVEHLKARNRELEAQIASLLKQRGRFTDLITDLKQSVTAARPLPPAPITRSKLPSPSRPIDAVLKISDWQIGEVISAAETEGFGEFNWRIAQRDVMEFLGPKMLAWVDMHRRAGFQIPRLHIFSEGDFVSGNIHKELEVTNEFPLPVAVVNAGMLFSSLVAQLAPHFERVVVWELDSDNHGRLNPKPQAKQKSRNNASYLVHAVANERLKQHTNVTIMQNESMKFVAEVQGWRFLIEHGDGIKSQLGIPYYGLERERGREATRRMGTGKEFDYLSIGHYHVPAIVSGNILINGCLTGTTEFDHSCGRHAEPAQVSFMVHPAYGVFNWVAWKFKRGQGHR